MVINYLDLELRIKQMEKVEKGIKIWDKEILLCYESVTVFIELNKRRRFLKQLNWGNYIYLISVFN